MNSFQPECGEDEVIMMQTARYGRMKLGKCVAKNYGKSEREVGGWREREREIKRERDCREGRSMHERVSSRVREGKNV